MGFHIEVIKTSQQDENFVHYIYQFYLPFSIVKNATSKIRYKSKLVSGKLKIDKINGNVCLLEIAEGDTGSHAQRASWALMKHWKLGEYPDKTYWES